MIAVRSAARSLLAALVFIATDAANAADKVKVGVSWSSSDLPLLFALDKGYFKEAGLDVEAIKFAGAQQVMEAMLSGRCDGSATTGRTGNRNGGSGGDNGRNASSDGKWGGGVADPLAAVAAGVCWACGWGSVLDWLLLILSPDPRARPPRARIDTTFCLKRQ